MQELDRADSDHAAQLVVHQPDPTRTRRESRGSHAALPAGRGCQPSPNSLRCLRFSLPDRRASPFIRAVAVLHGIVGQGKTLSVAEPGLDKPG